MHEARTHLKKVRALLRLSRPATGKAFDKRENAAMRKAAQAMSPIRDAHVRVQTIEKLKKRRGPAAIVRVQAALVAHLRQAIERAENEDWSKEVASEMEQALCRLADWPLKRLRTKSLRSGLKGAYKKARSALAATRRHPTDTNLHELRKRVKDLWYHLRLLGGDRPRPIKALTKRLRELAQKLGDHHDLMMLLAARADNPCPNRRIGRSSKA